LDSQACSSIADIEATPVAPCRSLLDGPKVERFPGSAAGRDGFSPNAEDLRGIFAANIPAETTDSDSAWKSAVCKVWMVVRAVRYEPVSPRRYRNVRELTGQIREFRAIG
jgi:hypothetical protein